MKTDKYIKLFLLSLILVLSIYLFNKYGIENIKENLENMGELTPLVLIFLRSTSIIIPALPGTAYSIIAGALLGFKKAYFIICLADLASCIITFSLSRQYGSKVLNKITTPKLTKKIQDLGNKHIESNFLLMTGLLMTGLFDFMSYAIGLSNVKRRKYLIALLISVFVSNIPIVALGAGILSNGKILLSISIIGIILLGIINRKLNPIFDSK
tara:strand:- start:1929 stop:2564 length:636 start_codon:yes stop_codon:yes gene_type:complete